MPKMSTSGSGIQPYWETTINENSIKKLVQPILLIGIGNVLKGDDAAGTETIKRLKDKGINLNIINCGESPENYLTKIVSYNSKSIIFVDAADMRLKPGDIRLYSLKNTLETGLSTHGISLSILAEYIKENTNADLYLIGIQPKDTKLGNTISQEVDNSINYLVSLFLNYFGSKDKL